MGSTFDQGHAKLMVRAVGGTLNISVAQTRPLVCKLLRQVRKMRAPKFVVAQDKFVQLLFSCFSNSCVCPPVYDNPAVVCTEVTQTLCHRDPWYQQNCAKACEDYLCPCSKFTVCDVEPVLYSFQVVKCL